MIHAVHRGDVREQRLRRADVRRRLLAPDVLLARLQRHAVREVAVRIDRDADDAAGRLPDERFARREKRGVRSAVAHRHAEPLRAADDDVRAHFARRNGDRQREQIGGHRDEHVLLVRARDERAQVDERAVVVGRLHVRAEHIGAELRARPDRRSTMVMPSGSARPLSTSSTCGYVRSDTQNVLRGAAAWRA